MTTIAIVCAWCGKTMGIKPGDGQTNAETENYGYL